MWRLQLGLLVFNAVNLMVWVGLLVPTMTVWKDSLPWTNFMSAYALIAAFFAGLTASIVGLEQLRQNR